MKVILNSDVLHHPHTLVREQLGRSLPALFEACRDRNQEIIVPLTTRLEFDRHQSERAEFERDEIRKAYKLLGSVGHDIEEGDLDELVKPSSLIDLIQQHGVRVSELDPTYDELQEAHRRAALHELPHPPDAKSDEMRDLVIWAQAVNVARREGGAILVSMDHLHTHERGDAEANEVGLVRLKTVDAVLEHFDVQTPAARRIDELLRAAWPSLHDAEPTLPAEIDVTKVSRASFLQGDVGLARASADVTVTAGNGEQVEASVEFEFDGGRVRAVRLDDLRVSGNALQMAEATPNLVVDHEDQPSPGRLAELRAILRR
jgi:hypothetical protein